MELQDRCRCLSLDEGGERPDLLERTAASLQAGDGKAESVAIGVYRSLSQWAGWSGLAEKVAFLGHRLQPGVGFGPKAPRERLPRRRVELAEARHGEPLQTEVWCVLGEAVPFMTEMAMMPVRVGLEGLLPEVGHIAIDGLICDRRRRKPKALAEANKARHPPLDAGCQGTTPQLLPGRV